VISASPAFLAGLASFLLLLGGCGSSDPEPASDATAGRSAPGACSTTVASLAAVQEAVASATAESTVCLADGRYDKLTLDSGDRSGEVTVRAEHPARATIAGASLAGDNLTLSRLVSTGGIQVQPGATAITVEHNRITGGGQGIDAGPTDTTTLNDIAIVANQMIGPFGEDAIHLNRYHDSDGDGIGVLIEGNEITNVRENGAHSDCLQTVWVGDHLVFRKNYLHDNRCQGFFVKDQASLGGVSGPIEGIAVEDNLFLRNHEPCGPPLKSCGQPLYFQLFGPYSQFRMSHNTIWGDGIDSIAAFREGTSADTVIEDNVIYRLWTDTDMSPATLRDNTICEEEAAVGGAWPQPSGETIACELNFPDATTDDYRLGDGRGVGWAPAEQHYGP
jgi:Right handed beta helix region